jgi:photosystem II stability/assembly factor-like uncharacterized protein
LPAIRSSLSPKSDPLNMMMWVSGASRPMTLAASIPFIRAIARSITTTSGRSTATRSTASKPFETQATTACEALVQFGDLAFRKPHVFQMVSLLGRARKTRLLAMTRLYAATGDAIARLDEKDDSWNVELSLSGSGAHCLAVDPTDPDMVYAGLREGSVQRTADGGRSWVESALPQPGVFSLAVSAADGGVYAGTEPSALFRSDDRGETWRELSRLLDLPSRPTWSFPPRPWTSHVRWIAPSPHDRDLVLVGIELGGLMRTTDGGETWQDHRPGAQPDVHSLAWHPRVEGRAYEAGGGGAAFSEDAGETWQAADEGRDRHYTWSVAVDPDDPELWYVSASTGPFAAHGRRDPQARIYARRDGEWRALVGGLPEPIPAMPYALVAADGRLFAGLADGQIWESTDHCETWQACVLSGDPLTELHALVCAESG